MATRRKTLTGMTVIVVALCAVTMAARTPQTREAIKGEGTVTTEKMSGEVVLVDGNTLVVRMSNGELRTFTNVPDSRRATIDGREVGVRELVPGTRLNATITKTVTPVTVRTTTVGTGKVQHVSGNTVILLLPNGENHQYVVRPEYKFNINGKPATVNDLRKGMTVSAEKIVESPTVEIASDTTVTGSAPRVAAAPAPAPEPAPRVSAMPTPAPEPPPAKLPKTASPMFFEGLLGLLLVGGATAIRLIRHA